MTKKTNSCCFLFLLSSFVFLFSSMLSAMEEDEGIPRATAVSTIVESDTDERARLQAHTDLFNSFLKAIKSYSLSSPVSIFVSYSHDSDAHKRQVEALCDDLVNIGIPFTNILFDQWSNRPGGHTDLYENVEKILQSEKVILVGSSRLKERYEALESGVISREISFLRDRVTRKGQLGVIPVWFMGGFEGCFPAGISRLVGRSLSEDYHVGFFDLVIDLYQLNPSDNPVKYLKQQFTTKRGLLGGVLEDYGTRLLRFQGEKAKQEESELRAILEAAHRERDERLRSATGGEASSASLHDIEELRSYMRGGNIEITNENSLDVKRLAGSHKQAFKDYNKGIHLKHWKSSRGGREFLELLSAFSNAKRLKIEIDWEREKEEEEIVDAIERATTLYPKLEELGLVDCRLTDQRLLGILDGLRDISQLKQLNVRENYFRPGIIEKIRRKASNLEGLEIEEDEYPPVTEIIPWTKESEAYYLFQRGVAGHEREYASLMMKVDQTEDPVILSYCALLKYKGGGIEVHSDFSSRSSTVLFEKVNLGKLRERAIRDDPEAQNNLGLILLINTADEGCSYRWCRKAATKGFIEAECTLAAHAQLRYDIQAAIDHYEKAGRRGHAGAYMKLSTLYAEMHEEDYKSTESAGLTEGITRKDAVSNILDNLLNAAKLGHVDAQYQMACGYEKTGRLQNALEWFTRAAENGHEGARLKLLALSSAAASKAATVEDDGDDDETA